MTNTKSKPDLFSQLHHPAVRDLAWTCFSTPLLARLPGSDAELLAPVPDQRDRDWLVALDREPGPLLEALARGHSTRLGLYFERLWCFYLEQHPDWELLEHNLQVQKAGQTFGAFDFLCRYRDQYWHLELAIKLYLGLPGNRDLSAWNQWWGPNCNDRLDIKLARLTEHQLPLSTNPSGRDALTQRIGVDTTWRRGLLLKGYYFYPGGTVPCPPADSHPQHHRGEWWPLKEFLTQPAERQWQRLPRGEWLAPAQTHAEDTFPTSEELKGLLEEQVGEEQRPQLVAEMIRHGDSWREQRRAFVVPDYWPNMARPSRNT